MSYNFPEVLAGSFFLLDFEIAEVTARWVFDLKNVKSPVAIKVKDAFKRYQTFFQIVNYQCLMKISLVEVTKLRWIKVTMDKVT